MKTFASIITIGDELLIGQVIDTNSAFIAQELNKLGISIKNRIAVGDDYNDIVNALEITKKTSQIIIITGGLGPTADDITKPLLCKYFGGEMILHQETLEHVEHIFKHILKRPMIERNRLQAMVPSVCTVLKNEVGTAPGMMFEQNDVLFFSLPGVPHEMKWLINNKVCEAIKEKHHTTFIEHRTLLTAGVGESFLAEKLIDFETNLKENFKLAYLPNYGMVRLRLTGTSSNNETLKLKINTLFNHLQELVKDVLITNLDETLEQTVAKKLIEQNATIATAESCTGGFIAHLLTSLSGASSFFKGSIIAYDNSIKINELKVNENDLQNYGAVSEPIVTQMAFNVLQKMNTDYAIAVSGIMGPNGGTLEKPVGTAWIAIANKTNTIAKKIEVRFDRTKNIDLTAKQSLLMLLQTFP